MNQSNREEVISADLNRIGNLSGREMMNLAMRRSVRADFYNPATNAFDDLSSAGKATASAELSGLTRVPSLDGIAHTFDMSLGQGEGTLPANPSSADVSGNQLLRWPSQTVTWPSGGNPDATNAKICLIVATPADDLDDEVSRNTLVDPASRATVPANVFKTSNPLATISVVAGSAASSPVAPAVPSGTLALFEVYVPALATDSTAFLAVRRAWRSIEFPGTSQHGIVKGCVPSLQGTFASGPALLTFADQPHRLVIDGELLTFASSPSNWLTVDNDTVTPPVAGAAGHDSPAYLYLCGGRNFPHLNYKMVSGGVTPVPVTFIASLTPPDSLGYPTASLAIATPSRAFPRASCCYVGLYFRNAGLTTMVPSFYDGDFIYSSQTVGAGSNPNLKGFLMPSQSATNAFAAYTFAGQPAISDIVDLAICYQSSAADQGFFSTSSTSAGQFWSQTISGVAGDPGFGYFSLKLALATNPFVIYVKSTGGNGTMYAVPAGYNMKIPRLAR
jgi:hypothetical protein